MLRMLPQPRLADLQPASGPPAGAAVRVDHDPSLPAQGYELALSADGVVLRHADDAGRRYGEQVLDRLRADADAAGERLPAGMVRDHPDLLVRGYMLDVSRDRVPTMETLRWLVDVLAACRYNQLQLYVEHTFAHAGHEVVWRDASPLTADEMRTLDGWCAERGIELVANRNSFGHMERWLVHDEYRARAECPDGFELPFFGGRRPPSTLAPTPENAEFAVGLVRELAAAVRSRTVNVGCDETFELGRCASRDAVAARGKAAVFTDHLLRIVEPLLADGYTVQFWGDMVRRDASVVDRLPAVGLVPLVWNYEAPAAPGTGMWGLMAGVRELVEELGLPDDAHLGFAAHVRAFAERRLPFVVAPGTSTWNTLVGRWDNARANLLDAVDVAAAHGCEGVLVTDWGDNGHLQPLAISLVPLVFGGAVAWCAERNRDLADTELAAEVDRLLGGAPGTPGIGRALPALGALHRRTGCQTINGSPLFGALFPDPPLPMWGDPDPAGLDEVLAVLDDAERAVAHASPPGPQGDAVRAEVLAAVDLARHGAWRLLRGARQRGAVAAVPDDRALAAHLRDAIARQREAWLARSRPGGLEDSLGRLRPALAEYGASA